MISELVGESGARGDPVQRRTDNDQAHQQRSETAVVRWRR